MNPEQWAHLDRGQQSEYVARFGPPPPSWSWSPNPSRTTNFPALIGVVSGLVGFLVIPILLGPVAVVCGIVGYHLAARPDGPGHQRMAAAAVVVGALATLGALARMGLF